MMWVGKIKKVFVVQDSRSRKATKRTKNEDGVAEYGPDGGKLEKFMKRQLRVVGLIE